MASCSKCLYVCTSTGDPLARSALLVYQSITDGFSHNAGVPIFADPARQNCLALLAFVSILWCTEALPLFVTSMLVPFLAVVLRVMVDSSGKHPQRLSAPDAADAILKAMFSQASSQNPQGTQKVAELEGSKPCRCM